ncbi:MAG: hypothetical protein IKO80_03410 [Lachnospiraceae bacterium]|nr:hypothetical protein [Lachnospiraceae bacterium]
MALNISFYLNAIHGKLKRIHTYLKEGELLFAPFYQEFDIELDLSDTYFTRLRKRERNPEQKIIDVIEKNEVITFFEEYFAKIIVPALNPHTGMDICTIILHELEENKNINENTKNRYYDLYNSGKTGAFLADIFLYSLSVQNKFSAGLRMSDQAPLCSDYAVLSCPVYSAQQDLLAVIQNISPQLSFSMSGKYNVSYTAKNTEHAFRMHVFVTKDSFPDDYPSFNSLLGYVLFSGKSVDLQVQTVRILSPDGNILQETHNSLIIGDTVMLPELRVPQYDHSDFSICPSSITISSLNNRKTLELRDSLGDILIPWSTYKIEREHYKNRTRAIFILENDDYLDLRLTIDAPLKPRKHVKIKTSISLTMKDRHSTLCNIRYFDVLSKMGKADNITLFSNADKDVAPFLSFSGFLQNNETDGSNIEDLLRLFHQLYRIEDHLGLKFEIDELTQADAYFIQILYHLITKGKIILGQQTLLLDCAYKPEESLQSCNSGQQPVIYDSPYTGVNILGRRIDLSEMYRIRWSPSVVDIEDNNKRTVLSSNTILYDPKKIDATSLNELQMTIPTV